MALLQIVQDACIPESLERPSTLFPTYDEGDTTAQDMLRAVTACARSLRDGYDWSICKARHTFTALAQEVQTNKLPSDFHRIIEDTFWRSSTRTKVCGPLSDEDYGELKSGIVSRVTTAYYMQGGELSLIPDPTTSDTFAFQYIRTAIGKNASNVRLAAFTADTDVPLWDDELMIAGAVYFYRKNKKLDAQQAYADYEVLRRDRIKKDGGGRVLHMGGYRETSDEMVARMKQGVILGGAAT